MKINFSSFSNVRKELFFDCMGELEEGYLRHFLLVYNFNELQCLLYFLPLLSEIVFFDDNQLESLCYIPLIDSLDSTFSVLLSEGYYSFLHPLSCDFLLF
jgi:hypothetical protein